MARITREWTTNIAVPGTCRQSYSDIVLFTSCTIAGHAVELGDPPGDLAARGQTRAVPEQGIHQQPTAGGHPGTEAGRGRATEKRGERAGGLQEGRRTAYPALRRRPRQLRRATPSC
jgi:hypothetical protein